MAHDLATTIRKGTALALGWSEQAVTWHTAPATDALPVASLDGASDGTGYSSREGPASQQPELVVECGSR